MELSVHLKTTDDLQRRFNDLAGRVKNLEPLFKRIGIQLLNEIDTNFQMEGNAGTKWAPLLPRTIAERRNKSKATIKILQDNGDLKKFFSMKASYNAVRVGTPVIYAPTHEDGNPKLNIPQRKMLPTKTRALEIALPVAQGYIDEQVEKFNK